VPIHTHTRKRNNERQRGKENDKMGDRESDEKGGGEKVRRRWKSKGCRWRGGKWVS